MNCYEHPQQPAVAQCLDCGKGLCRECASLYSIPICRTCNKNRISGERKRIIQEMLLTFAIGISLAILLVRKTEAGHSYPLSYTVISYIIYTYVFCGLVPGWKTLTGITANFFLFLPLVGWVFYLVIKVLLSFGVGLVMFPVRTVRNIVRLGTLRKIKV